MANETDKIQETASADTLKPGAGSGGTQSRAETLATFTALMSQLGKEDLTKFFNMAQDQIGHEADNIPSGNASKNKASVAAKVVKEDIDDMFASDELSEEFKERASTIFEAIVNTRILTETARLEEEFEEYAIELEEEFEAKLEEETSAILEDVSEKLDQYLDYVVENWMTENEIALETSLRADIAESFIADLHTLFTEHHIVVPENKLDLVAEMKAELDATKAALNESEDKAIELESIINEAVKASTFSNASEGLAETQVEKLRELSEGVEFTNADAYKTKIEMIKENYFNKKPSTNSSGILVEEIAGSEEPDKVVLPANMSQYAQAISKSAK
jgi:hypothetical protein